MKNLIKELIRKREIKVHTQRLDACAQIPNILREMNKRQGELAEEVINNPPFPPEVMKEKIDAINQEFLQKNFPNEWEELKKACEEDNVPIGEVANYIMGEILLPKLIDLGKVEIERSLNEIEALCREGVDRELDELNRLRKRG